MASNITSSSEKLYVNESNPYYAPGSSGSLVGQNFVDWANTDWQADAQQVVLIMVGLPARGKSLISGKGSSISCCKFNSKADLSQSNATCSGLLSKRKSSTLASTDVKVHPTQMPNSLTRATQKARRHEEPLLKLPLRT